MCFSNIDFTWTAAQVHKQPSKFICRPILALVLILISLFIQDNDPSPRSTPPLYWHALQRYRERRALGKCSSCRGTDCGATSPVWWKPTHAVVLSLQVQLAGLIISIRGDVINSEPPPCVVHLLLWKLNCGWKVPATIIQSVSGKRCCCLS